MRATAHEAMQAREDKPQTTVVTFNVVWAKTQPDGLLSVRIE